MRKKTFFSRLSVYLLIGAMLFGTFMCAISSFISYSQFKRNIEILYGNETAQFAETAVSYIDTDRLFDWITNGADKHWADADRKLNELTETAQLAFIYVTVVDKLYKARTYVFDTINKKVSSEYKVIPLGHVSSLENKDEVYIKKLRRVIEKGENYSSFVYSKAGGHVTTAIPVRNSRGEVVAIMSVVKAMSEIRAYKNRFLTHVIGAALIYTILFLFLYSVSLHMWLVRPLMFIIEETSHFAQQHGELSGILKKVKNKDELGILAKSIEKMSVDMNRYIRELTAATAEKERLDAELSVATKIQAEMLPRVFPPYENHPELELFASMCPAKEVGGDFYDFFMIDDNHFAVVVGDVSGKGVPAALFMVIAKTLLKDAAYRFSSPAEIFTHVNSILCEGNESGLFVTCWMAILEISSGKLQFANAGHPAPVLCHDNHVSYLTTKPDLMLAAMDGIAYKDHTVRLDANDRLFIYTDGVTEATDGNNELYGEERLLKILENAQRKSSKEILDIVNADISSFVNGAPQFDDITMLEMVLKDVKRER